MLASNLNISLNYKIPASREGERERGKEGGWEGITVRVNDH